MPLHRLRTTCRLCDSPRVRIVLPLKPSAIADAFVPKEKLAEEQPVFPLDLYQCQDCGHAQLLDILDPRVLFSNYIYETSASASLCQHFRLYADDIIERFRPAPGTLAIDIGSNIAVFLGYLKEQGMNVLGIDPAESIAAKATARGIETLPLFFTSDIARRIRAERGPATILSANNVFAHSDALPDMADGIRELLAPDGVFLFEVSYLLDMVDNVVFDWIYHEHLCYHSIRPLRTFFDRHGLELIDARRVGTKGGSIRCTVQHAGGPQPINPSIGELAAIEEKVGLATPVYFKALADRIDAEKSLLLERLRAVKKEGKTIAAYGASATATTLTYHFELGPYIDYLLDDDPLRHGLYSPGWHHPVHPSEALYDGSVKRPDLIVVLAWRYATPIAKRHHAYLASGGRLLVPLPHFHEITS